ncbi:TRAP transporter substrate-binding protein [Desulfosporosinus nitroreducens]|uniref:TRAP transporter substrate-binding protein n=1 Tax=Desulfosporosinus nitroreducens TaxID=2018668 RepID=A0ABT8QWZ0_9FIRM|nr:TRAP transporter substrate-binding protein [Desulfosporosinus nitroreducens]MDO0825019.1 TRAP transporter substrate-binding protein [Desulfosporosinus nitroreducens]
MKKRLCKSIKLRSIGKGILLGVLALNLLFVSGCGQTASAPAETKSQTVELKLAHFFPATHPAEKELVQPWAKAIDTATEGRVKITSYPGQTLLQADAVYDGVVNGIADLGLSCFSYTRGSFPVSEVFELPGIKYANSKAASKVAWEGIKELNPKEVQDTKLMMVFTTGPGDLYTKEPVRALKDLKGLEIRATGLSAKSLAALGAMPVAMAQSEAYEALSKGVVKGNLGPVEVLQGWKQAEVTKYVTFSPFLYNNLFYVTMNLDKWNSLDPKDQKAIETVNQKFFEEVAMSLWDKQNESALKYAAEKGMEVITLSQEEQNQWISLIKPIQDDFVTQMNQKGQQGQEILDKVKNLADQYNKEYQ